MENPTSEIFHHKRIALYIMLAKYYTDIYEATKIQAGYQNHLKGEQPTKYFTRLAQVKDLKQ